MAENPFARSVTGSVASSPNGSESPITAHVVVANNPLDSSDGFAWERNTKLISMLFIA